MCVDNRPLCANGLSCVRASCRTIERHDRSPVSITLLGFQSRCGLSKTPGVSQAALKKKADIYIYIYIYIYVYIYVYTKKYKYISMHRYINILNVRPYILLSYRMLYDHVSHHLKNTSSYTCLSIVVPYVCR